jgi:hypothetical protein
LIASYYAALSFSSSFENYLISAHITYDSVYSSVIHGVSKTGNQSLEEQRVCDSTAVFDAAAAKPAPAQSQGGYVSKDLRSALCSRAAEQSAKAA